MSERILVHGCLEEPWRFSPHSGVLWQANRRKLSQLAHDVPRKITWREEPLLYQEMFYAPPKPPIGHQADRFTMTRGFGPAISFAASYHGRAVSVDRWLDQFEALLRQLFWWRASAHVEGEYRFGLTFVWRERNASSQWETGRLQPVAEWEFEGDLPVFGDLGDPLVSELPRKEVNRIVQEQNLYARCSPRVKAALAQRQLEHAGREK